MAVLRKTVVTFLLLPTLLLSSCSSDNELKPGQVVSEMMANSLSADESVDDYLAEIDPYLTDPGLASTRTRLEESPLGTTLEYSDVKIAKVVFADSKTAKVFVSFVVKAGSPGSVPKIRKRKTVLTLNHTAQGWMIQE